MKIFKYFIWVLFVFVLISCAGGAQDDTERVQVSPVTIRSGEDLSIYQINGSEQFRIQNIDGDPQHPEEVPQFVLSIEDKGSNILITLNQTQLNELGYGWKIISSP